MKTVILSPHNPSQINPATPLTAFLNEENYCQLGGRNLGANDWETLWNKQDLISQKWEFTDQSIIMREKERYRD